MADNDYINTVIYIFTKRSSSAGVTYGQKTQAIPVKIELIKKITYEVAKQIQTQSSGIGYLEPTPSLFSDLLQTLP